MLALPRRTTQARVGAEWLLHALAGGGELIRLGFLAQRTGTLADFEHTDAGLNQEETTAALTAAGEIRPCQPRPPDPSRRQTCRPPQTTGGPPPQKSTRHHQRATRR